MRIAKRIQELGGSYHCILDLQGDLTSAQRYYKMVHSLICGAHPAYGTHHAVAGSRSWGAFMTRFLPRSPNCQLTSTSTSILLLTENNSVLAAGRAASGRSAREKVPSACHHEDVQNEAAS